MRHADRHFPIFITRLLSGFSRLNTVRGPLDGQVMMLVANGVTVFYQTATPSAVFSTSLPHAPKDFTSRSFQPLAEQPGSRCQGEDRNHRHGPGFVPDSGSRQVLHEYTFTHNQEVT